MWTIRDRKVEIMFIFLLIVLVIVKFFIWLKKSEEEEQQKRNGWERYKHVSLNKFNEQFGINIRGNFEGRGQVGYIRGFRDYSQCPNMVFSIYINCRIMRSVVIIRKVKTGQLESVEVYERSGYGEYQKYRMFSRKDYLDLMVEYGYSFGGSIPYNGSDDSCESFIINASDGVILEPYESYDFCTDFDTKWANR